MKRFFSSILALAFAMMPLHANLAEKDTSTPPHSAKVVIIPIRSEISEPALYILRRGLKEAIAQNVDTIVLDMETPGGALDVTFEILKALEKFPGKTVTYVNREAMSAGALISAGTNEIWFAPGAVIGAAAPVDSSGADIESTMRTKIISYLKARIRAISEGKGYRGDVISAMIDADTEFKIDDKVIKKSGELLSLTSTEAMALYGNPPHALLGSGIAKDMDDLLNQIHGKGNYTTERLEPSWSEGLAQYLNALTPILLACGLLALFIEFKTPGFGFFGITGIILLGVVFFGHFTAGLAGYEALLVLAIGLILIALELFVFPGTIAPALIGGAMVFGALVWMMLDIWPNEPIAFSGGELVTPLLTVMAGIVGAITLFFAFLKFIPGDGPWGRMVLKTAVGGVPTGVRSLNTQESSTPQDLIGQSGIACTGLFPSGQIEVAGKHYEAKLQMGHADPGTAVIITGVSQFGLIVEVKS